MTNAEISALNREDAFFSWAVQSHVAPLSAVRCQRVYFWDADGKRYLDFSSQLMNVNIGHGNAQVTKAVQDQVEELVKDKETKEPLAPWNAKPHEMGVIAKQPVALRDRGMYTLVKWNWIFAIPPLCINEQALQEGIGILDEVLEIADLGCS